MGTELYIKNFKLYDLTTNTGVTKILSRGLWNCGNLTEAYTQSSIKSDGDLYGQIIYEI
jgi:hypothetical protein